MANLTRRGFLKSASIGGMTIVLATVPGLATSLDAVDAQSPEMHPAGRGPLVAFVGDASRDEISLLIGARKVVIHDRKLVAQLARAAR